MWDCMPVEVCVCVCVCVSVHILNCTKKHMILLICFAPLSLALEGGGGLEGPEPPQYFRPDFVDI